MVRDESMAEVYCYGHVSTGKVLRLRDHYPEPDGYAEVVEILENHAGEATGTALVLTRLGVTVALEGNWIGDIPECRRTLEFLRERGIDCTGLRVVPNYPGVTEVVISDGESRTVFGRYCDLLFTTKQWDDPDPSKIAAARIVCVDSSFGGTALAAARHAAAHGVPVATYDARHDAELTAGATALIISGEFIRREYPAAASSEDERASLFDRYLESCPGVVVFTAGSRPVWWGRGQARAPGRKSEPGGGSAQPSRRHELESFRVKVVDSAGAGDSFRGGLVYGMLQGWPDAECVRFAAAVAALVCTRAPGCVHPPTLAEVQELLSGAR
jgi:sugar/nucleoside kinase (ribokinase family)